MATKRKKINFNKITIDDLQFGRTAHYGHNVSHAKNRTNRAFKHNLHRATVILNGVKHRVEVPTWVLRKLKQLGLTNHKQLKSAE